MASLGEMANVAALDLTASIEDATDLQAVADKVDELIGYINAFGVGLTNVAVLILIGLAFSHRQATMRFIERLSRGRVRAPREDEFPIE